MTVGKTASTIRYMDKGQSAELLRGARRAAGLTQAELAGLAGTSQSAIAAYEGGKRRPTLPVLERLVQATGHLLAVGHEPDPTVFRLADLAEQILATPDEQRRLRLAFEFLRAAAEDGHSLRLLVAKRPRATGEPRFDALLAAMAEDLCVRSDLSVPPWALEDDRFLHGLWWISALPSGRARALVHTPASYRRRGVMLDRQDVSAA